MYIPKIASTLYLNQTIQNHVVEIVRYANQKRLISRKSPVRIAAVAIYLIAHLHGVDFTQCELAAASQITEMTITNHYQGSLNGLDPFQNQFHKEAEMRC